MIFSYFFQCIGKSNISIFLSLSRQLLFLVPLIGVMPLFFGISVVCVAMPLSDTVSAIFALVMIVRYMRIFKKGVKEVKEVKDNG